MKENKKAVAVTENNLPAVQDNPSYLPAMTREESLQAYGGDLVASDFTIPRLVVLESMSPQVTKEKAGHPGDFFVTGLNLNLGSDPIEFVILQRRQRSNLRWKPLKDGGGLLCRADDGKNGVGEPGGDCATCPHLKWTTDEKGQNVAPSCDENQNLIVVPRTLLQAGEAIPYALSGNKARLKEFKNLNTMLLPLIARRLPFYAKSIIVSATARDSKSIKGAVYHVFTFKFGNENALLPESEVKAAQALLQQFGSAKIAEPGESDAPIAE